MTKDQSNEQLPTTSG